MSITWTSAGVREVSQSRAAEGSWAVPDVSIAAPSQSDSSNRRRTARIQKCFGQSISRFPAVVVPLLRQVGARRSHTIQPTS